MAAIDKIYGTKEDYDEFQKWCSKYYPKALEYFYGWDWTDNNTHPITNFPIEIDGFMLLVCDIAWVTDRIKAQYGLINPIETAAPDLLEALKDLDTRIMPEERKYDEWEYCRIHKDIIYELDAIVKQAIAKAQVPPPGGAEGE